MTKDEEIKLKVYCLCKGAEYETPYTIGVFSSLKKAMDRTGTVGWKEYDDGWQTTGAVFGWYEINEFEVDK